MNWNGAMDKIRNNCFIWIFSFFLVTALLGKDPGQKIEEAKSKLQIGVNNWNPEFLKDARDLFLNILIKENKENVYLMYYIALSDYRLTTFYLASEKEEKAENYSKEGLKYLEKAIESDPSFGESYALYASLLGVEIAFHPERAMALGPKISEYFAKSFQRDPDNPRINLLKGISILYTPETFGGGADKAIILFQKSIDFFEKESIEGSLKPSWGREEAYLNLGLAHKQMKEYDKAIECLKKALQVNPDYGYAVIELFKIEKEKEKK